MSELYLIAHKVRGEPAFDVAIKMDCPECHAQGCGECDDTGYFWIIPTSGHRAYPYWGDLLSQGFSHEDILAELPMPEGLPDHYTTRAAPRVDLATALGLRKPAAASPPLPRRL